MRALLQGVDLRGCVQGELADRLEISFIGAAACQFRGHDVFRHEGGSGDRVEAVLLQLVADLDQAVVKAAVAEGHDRDGQGAVSLEEGLDGGQDLVGDPAGVDRRPENDQLAGGVFPQAPAEVGQGDIVLMKGNSLAAGKGLRDGIGDLFGVSRRTETDGGDFFQFHL